MSRRARSGDYDAEAFARALDVAIRAIDGARRDGGLPSGLSQRAIAAHARIDAADLSYAIKATRGRSLDADEREHLVDAIERHGAWTAEWLRSRRTPTTPAAAPLDSLVAPLRRLANLPPNDRVGSSVTAPWRPLLALGYDARRRRDWDSARERYASAERRARAVRSLPGAALALANQAQNCLDVYAHDRAPALIAAALRALGAADLEPRTRPPASAVELRLAGDDTALEAYLLAARVTASREHDLGRFRAARRAASTAVRVGELRYGGGYDALYADALHFLAKALIEEAAAEDADGGLDEAWRTPATGDRGWRAKIDQALRFYDRERMVRPLDDVTGHLDSWRNSARAHRIAAQQGRQGPPRLHAHHVTEALRQASRLASYVVEAGRATDLMGLHLDRAR